MSRTVYQNNFKGWNAQFHPMKRTISSYKKRAKYTLCPLFCVAK